MPTWTKTVKRLEELRAEPLRGRVHVRTTRYHKADNQLGRGIIVVDGEKIWDFCHYRWLQQQGRALAYWRRTLGGVGGWGTTTS